MLGNPCDDSPCLNGGTCEYMNDEDTLFKCTCPSGCSGKKCETCEKKSCKPNFCQNRGECVLNLNGRQYCICPFGYSGQYCENCKIRP